MTNFAWRAILDARAIRRTLAAAPLHPGRILRGWTTGCCGLVAKAR